MKREKLLTICVVVLFVMNIGTLGLLFFTHQHMAHPPHGGPGGHGPDRMIIEGLKLTPEQISRFETLKHDHHEAMLKEGQKDRELHRAYFALLRSENPNKQMADSILQQMSDIVKERNEITFAHFADLRKLCTEEQKKRFDDILDEVTAALGRGQAPEEIHRMHQ